MQSYLGALNNYDGDSNEKFKQRNGLKFAREPHYLEKFVAFTVPVRSDIPQRIFLSRIKKWGSHQEYSWEIQHPTLKASWDHGDIVWKTKTFQVFTAVADTYFPFANSRCHF